MCFDYIVGNPPYQKETDGKNKTYAPPIYDKFLSKSYSLSDSVVMIHPARFLFNTGCTSRIWNNEMLNSPHLRIMKYFPKSADAFPNTDTTGGIAITYFDKQQETDPIKLFIPYKELRSIVRKVENEESIETIVSAEKAYKLQKESCIVSNVFEAHPELFFNEKPCDGYVGVYGFMHGKRVLKWINGKYIRGPDSMRYYKVLVSRANGSSGSLADAPARIISPPFIAEPMTAHTQTFLSIGQFKTKGEAEACLKYIKTKFARALLGVRKVTAAVTPQKWVFVPLQDFTSKSDIDWSKIVKKIDCQLYAKYQLSEKEVEFIESHVKGI